ncbi:hypothetical protein Micbo1qcDRAFT_212333 [Microdochium bolleyi]|uniref:Carbohydrate esterase family 16 protein n=1 Tax=Microdochium bolleyi TaxID=196109 RepID=A0A136IY40_9PEZI|nr:hypothetical protein Micbo1qcDRAFT_212333 [Microdochium bolleyi]
MWLSPFLWATIAALSVSAKFAGFPKLERLVVFGDSYSAINFRVKGAPPSPSKPWGDTASYLTTSYNESRFLTYDMAVGGSTVDINIVPTPSNFSFVKQVDLFAKTYGRSGAPMFQKPDTTLVAAWFGINEVLKTFAEGDLSSSSSWDKTYDQVFKKYLALITTLRDRGARNFLFINVPPVHRNPYIRGLRQGQLVPRAASLIANLNQRIAKLAAKVRSDYPDTTMYTYDAYAALQAALDNPKKFPELARVRDTTNVCGAYHDGTPAMNTKLPQCQYAVDQYFWFDTIHPGSSVHNLMAKQISELLLR